MAIKLQIAYQKRLGLPGYSSHSFGVTVETEVSGLSDIEETNHRLYALLQRSVDQELQSPGFIPKEGKSNGHRNGSTHSNGHHDHQNKSDTTDSSDADWNCSAKQRSFITNIVQENNVDWREVESLCKQRFNRPLKSLNRLEASGLIDQLLAVYGDKSKRGRSNGYARNGRRSG